jgi:hypothetical protein
MEIGSLVLCHCAYEKYQDHFDFDVNIPLPGKIYTIRKVITLGTFKGLLLEEIINEKVDTLEFGEMELQFEATCFSVVQEADLSEIKQLLR